MHVLPTLPQFKGEAKLSIQDKQPETINLMTVLEMLAKEYGFQDKINTAKSLLSQIQETSKQDAQSPF